MEVLMVTPAIQNVIRKNQTYEIPSLMGIGKKYGMQTIEEVLAQLYKNDLISLDQALARVSNPEALRKRLG